MRGQQLLLLKVGLSSFNLWSMESTELPPSGQNLYYSHVVHDGSRATVYSFTAAPKWQWPEAFTSVLHQSSPSHVRAVT